MEQINERKEPGAEQVVEYLAYSSTDWDGEFNEAGIITNEGTKGWCITAAGDAVIHAGELVDEWTVTRPKKAIQLKKFEMIANNVIYEN